MKITKARDLQDKFQAGLQICGETPNGRLEWIGSMKQWEKKEDLELRDINKYPNAFLSKSEEEINQNYEDM